jgi:hypothetical protein
MPAITGVLACTFALVAWLVRPDNQLGVTRPTTVLASAAIGLGLVGLLLGSAQSTRSPRVALAVIANLFAILAGLGALLVLLSLPYGN